MTIFFEQIAQVVRTDEFFFEQIAGAIQTKTKSVRKLQTIRNIICVRGGKLGKLTPPPHPPGKSDPFRGGGMDIF